MLHYLIYQSYKKEVGTPNFFHFWITLEICVDSLCFLKYIFLKTLLITIYKSSKFMYTYKNDETLLTQVRIN